MKVTKNFGIKSNIVLAMTSKIFGLIASFLMIPILLKSLGIEQYGIWVTLSSVAAWLMLFDFGLGNSFKNTVATSDSNKIQKEYSLAFSLYFYVSLMLSLFLILFLLLNTQQSLDKKSIFLLYLPLCVIFPLRLFGFGIQGLRLVGINSVLETLRIIIWLLFAIYYVYFIEGQQLYILSLIFVLASIVPQLIQFIIFKSKCGFSLSPKLITPAAIIKESSFKLGIRFFVIQLSSLVSFNLGNILIYNNFGASHVALYDIFNKVFVAALSVFNMSIAVMWPEISKAFAEKNIVKCNKLYQTLLLIAFCFCIGLFIVTLNFDILLSLLMVDTLLVLDTNLLWVIMALTCLQAVTYCGAVVLNAINKLKLQIYLAFASILLIYPLFKFLVHFDFGIVAYPLATIVLVLISTVLCNVTSLRILKANNEH